MLMVSTNYSTIEETGIFLEDSKVHGVFEFLMCITTLSSVSIAKSPSMELRTVRRASKEERIIWKAKNYNFNPTGYSDITVSKQLSTLAQELRAIRERAIAKGMPLLSLDEINNELRSIRGS